MTTHRPRRALWLAVAAMVAMTSCSSSNGDNVATDDLTDQLDNLGGPNVADTTITHEPGSDTLKIGGLTITDPIFQHQEFRTTRTITIPPTWPTLAVAIGDDCTSPEEQSATIGAALFAQTELVSTEATRQQLINEAFRLYRLDGADIVHRSTPTNPENDVSCWAEIRRSEPPKTALFSQRGVIMIGGPGIASFALTVTFGDPENTLAAIGDLVEAACGSRPDGL